MTELFVDLLDRLDVKSGDIVFLHTSYSRLGSLVASPQDLILQLLKKLGPSGTLVMPRYAWHLDPSSRPWKGYAKYCSQLPVMDLRHTPANIGVVPELFRLMEGVETSISHFWPLTAKGGSASAVLEAQSNIDHPYGRSSCFSRLLDCNAKVLGLGVSLNTTSIAPVTDFRVGHPIFFGPLPGVVVDLAGRPHETLIATMLPEAVRDMEPSRILTGYLKPGTDFPFEDLDGNFFFSYPTQLYHDAAVKTLQAPPNRYGAVRWMRANDAVESASPLRTNSLPDGESDGRHAFGIVREDQAK